MPRASVGKLESSNPRGSKYPIFKDSGPKNHTRNGFCRVLQYWVLGAAGNDFREPQVVCSEAGSLWRGPVRPLQAWFRPTHQVHKAYVRLFLGTSAAVLALNLQALGLKYIPRPPKVPL